MDQLRIEAIAALYQQQRGGFRGAARESVQACIDEESQGFFDAWSDQDIADHAYHELTWRMQK